MNIDFINNEITFNGKVLNVTEIEKINNTQFHLITTGGSLLFDLSVTINNEVKATITDFANALNIPLKSINYSENYQHDKAFGELLLDTFLTDNRNLPVAFTPSISLQLLQAFAPVKALAEVGDIKSVKYLLSNATVDTIFTQERKDKYIQMCNNHLGL